MTTLSPPAPSPSRAVHRRSLRFAAAIATAAALIGTGTYVATTSIGPHATPRTEAGATVNPSVQTQRELHESIAGQYGSRPAAGAPVNPSAQTRRELHRSIAGQYGPAH